MKATGIVRRIDDLGRVVVPKEIRKVLRIREGDPLEIYTGTAGEVILKKYSPISELGQIAESFAETASSAGASCTDFRYRPVHRSFRASQKRLSESADRYCAG